MPRSLWDFDCVIFSQLRKCIFCTFHSTPKKVPTNSIKLFQNIWGKVTALHDMRQNRVHGWLNEDKLSAQLCSHFVNNELVVELRDSIGKDRKTQIFFEILCFLDIEGISHLFSISSKTFRRDRRLFSTFEN